MRNLLLLLLFFCSSCFVVAQESSGVFRYGKLKNGLTYYIRHTEVQPGYADYYLVQNVGSLLEDDNQNGLAHVLEHMAFHSTQSFPDGVPAFLQRHGVETFNAVTKYDETIYHIDHVPTASQVLVGWIPGIGNAINATTAAGITEAMGWLLAKEFDEGLL